MRVLSTNSGIGVHTGNVVVNPCSFDTATGSFPGAFLSDFCRRLLQTGLLGPRDFIIEPFYGGSGKKDRGGLTPLTVLYKVLFVILITI